jgi:uncharacterized protein (TIGR03084 family)
VSGPVRPVGAGEPVRPAGAGEPVDALAAQQRELIELVADRDGQDLSRPSRCDGWSAADVLLHLAQTNEMAIASTQDRLGEHVTAVTDLIPSAGGIDEWAGSLVDAERSSPVAARDRYVASAAAQEAAFRAVDPDHRVQWVAGEMAARTLATTRLSETWIHTVDAAAAVDIDPAPTDRLWHVARLVWRTVPYALTRGGVSPAGDVAFDLVGPSGDRWAFGDPDVAETVVHGPAVELCTVAGQRGDAASTELVASGPDAGPVLTLMRTFA